MAPQMSLTVEFSREGLLDLRQRLDELLGQLVEEGRGGGGPSMEVLARDKVREMRARLRTKGSKSWDFVRTCAMEFGDDQEFSLEQVAEAMDLRDGVGKVRAYHRNVSRSEKQVDAALPSGAPRLFEPRWDGERYWYRMPPEVRQAVTDASRAEA